MSANYVCDAAALEAVKSNLNRASALVREAVELGASDPINDAAQLVAMLCHYSGWTDAEICADPCEAIAFARYVDANR